VLLAGKRSDGPCPEVRGWRGTSYDAAPGLPGYAVSADLALSVGEDAPYIAPEADVAGVADVPGLGIGR
jgi:hypothetical protein